MIVKITKAQMEAIKDAADTLSAMIGGSHVDKEFNKIVRRIDAFLKKNNEKRNYK